MSEAALPNMVAIRTAEAKLKSAQREIERLQRKLETLETKGAMVRMRTRRSISLE